MAKLADFLALQQVAQLKEVAKKPIPKRVETVKIPAPATIDARKLIPIRGPILSEAINDPTLDPKKRSIYSASETKMCIYNPNNSGFDLGIVSIIKATLPKELGRGFLRYYIIWTDVERTFLDRLEYEEVEIYRADNPLAARRFVEACCYEDEGQAEDQLPPELKMVRLISGNKIESRSGRAKQIGHAVKMADKDHTVYYYPCEVCSKPTNRRAYSHNRGRRDGFYCSEACQRG